jgi:diguanylate cyclase (GGDEF)-like protein
MTDQPETERDSLTGVYHRRRIPEAITAAIASGRAQSSPLSMIVVDIDGLRRFLDLIGLTAGDYVIREVSTLIAAHAPPNSLLARSSGDGFTLILPQTSRDSAQLLAQELTEVVSAHDFRFTYDHESDSYKLSVSITAGVGCVQTDLHEATESLVYSLVSEAYESLHFEKGHLAQRRRRQEDLSANREVVKSDSPQCVWSRIFGRRNNPRT